ncbi:MAG: ABC transporter ATP-binding protein [Nitrososphaeraceae archaeon]|nr:ABC transporter ATP-binding protein [Nitrososphaeraceae archaeon]MDW0135801.1 ABC transporter ATP-binding protein [Nitrososphaeraceae archaeon]
MTTLSIRNLTKKYGHLTALEDFSLEISSGEFMVLLGPSGCGKTTVLRCIAGLTDITSGEIYIGSELVNKIPPKDRDVAMVFQNYSLYPHMNVYNNIAFPLKMRKVHKDKINESVHKIARLLNIDNLLDRKPKEISGGQMQRVALGRALVREPKIFLMDEPLSNLDAKLRTEMRVEIKKLQEKVGITTLYITHDQAEAMSMADNVGIMDSGKLLQLDSPQKVYTDPANRFVASFIGVPPMNFIKFKIIKEGSLFLKFDDNNSYQQDKRSIIKIPDKLAENLENITGETIYLGVRPKDIILLKDDDDFDGLRLKGETTYVELLGDDSIAEVRLGDSSLKISNVTSRSVIPIVGKETTIGIRYDTIRLFTNSGERIRIKL